MSIFKLYSRSEQKNTINISTKHNFLIMTKANYLDNDQPAHL